MKLQDISDLFKNYSEFENGEIIVNGWIKTIRNSKNIGFIELNDGSCFKSTQVVFEENNINNFKEVIKYNVGTAISVIGKVIITTEAKQPFEINADKINLEGASNNDYPLQKKRHSLEFLRTIAHLRARTNTHRAIFKIRSAISFAIHQFFNNNGFVYIHTPIITRSDCEGAGEIFKVTTLPFDNIPKNDDGYIDYSKDFFGKATSLTVSGQLEGECMAMAFGKVYTFGPTFRAENSNTTRHASEFWMVEPEIAFSDIYDNMKLAEDMIKYVISYVLENYKEEMEFFNNFYDKNLLNRLNYLVNSEFDYITYTKAISILEEHKDKFEYKVSWGCDLQTEHERFLTEIIYKKPIFVIDYPKEIKAFYMRLNDDNKTVAGMDLLVPGVGEIIGGSQREERIDILLKRMKELNLDIDEYNWYLDIRKYGGTKHCGFGLGLERLIMYVTGIPNIRDVIPFPRTPGVADF